MYTGLCVSIIFMGILLFLALGQRESTGYINWPAFITVLLAVGMICIPLGYLIGLP